MKTKLYIEKGEGSLNLFGGFIKYAMPWLFGIFCLLTLVFASLGVFSKVRARLYNLLYVFSNVAMIVGAFLLGFNLHLTVLLLFSSLLFVVGLEYFKHEAARDGDKEVDRDL